MSSPTGANSERDTPKVGPNQTVVLTGGGLSCLVLHLRIPCGVLLEVCRVGFVGAW